MSLLPIEHLQRVWTATDLLQREGLCLDEQRWDDWLQMYCPRCEYWVPAWRSELVPTGNPDTETSLIYYAARSGLEDRVWRIKSGLSAASRQLPRTQHQVSNVLIETPRAEELLARYTWSVNVYEPRLATSHTFFGFGEVALSFEEGVWRFARKKLTLINDRVPTKLDFYCL